MKFMHRRNKKGFTLLEIIFALAILVIGLVGVLAIFPVGLRASKRLGDFTSATILAQRQMATIRKAGYDIYGIAYYPKRPFPDLDDNFSFSVVETAAIDPLGTIIENLNQVTVEIYWLDRGAVRSEVFITYLADHN